MEDGFLQLLPSSILHSLSSFQGNAATRKVRADEAGRRLDVHSYTLDAAGLNVGGVPYSGEHLTGSGVIGGHPVRCIPPEWLVKFHTGYELDGNDWHDVRLLCERFQIAVPDEYLKFRW